MNQLLQFLGNIPMQVWVLFAVFGFSVLGQVGKTITEVKKKRQIELDRQQRANEAMRTGRPVHDPEQEQASEVEARRQRLLEMQQRRQAQLDELRKRRQQMLQRRQAQQSQAKASPPPSASPKALAIQTSGLGAPALPTISRAKSPAPKRVPHPASHTVSRASSIGTRQAEPHATLHESQSLHAMEGRKLEPPAATKQRSAPFQHRLLDAQVLVRQSAMERHGIEFKDQQDLRRAVIMSEILSKPVVMRPDRFDDFS